MGLHVIPKAVDEERGIRIPRGDLQGNLPTTGHANGLIILNVEDADDSIREKVRVQMQERYRALLGHFLHEVGHYY